MNGTNHSMTAISRASSTPNGFRNGPATSTTASLSNQQLPPACGARQLCKLKRFLTTLQQFANDLSPDIGERVRSLVLGLVNSTWTIELFHSKLQEATNFPLRPFVIPFLKANLPLLQQELLCCARLAKQTPAQYLAQHEQLLLNGNCTSSIDSSEILLEVNENGKRKTPDRTKENGLAHDPLQAEHLSKRPFTLSPGKCFNPSNGIHPLPNGLLQQTPTTAQHYRLQDMALAHQYRDVYRHSEHRDLWDWHRPTAPGTHRSRQEEVIDHRLTDREWAEEWKHLDNLLNCIMDMVEKTRRSLTVLRRCQEADREELNHWIQRHSDTDMRKGGNSVQLPHNSSSPGDPQREIPGEMLHRQGYTQEEIWKKAEEAVNEVKRQAMMELKKAVLEAEHKAHEMIRAERAKMERALTEAKQQASEDAQSTNSKQEDSSEASRTHTASWSQESEADGPADLSNIARATLCSSNRRHPPCGARQMASVAPPSESCWNCGRKASETCSGCNTARYCGSFCQHRDWEKHHHVCGQNFQELQGCSIGNRSSPSRHSSVSSSNSLGPTDVSGSSNGARSPRDTGSTTASCSVSPPTPITVEAASH